jgi:hypothetical protein
MQGYFMWKDGFSHWGVNIFRKGHHGVEVPKYINDIKDRKLKLTVAHCHGVA